jgi:hypothetical protein
MGHALPYLVQLLGHAGEACHVAVVWLPWLCAQEMQWCEQDICRRLVWWYLTCMCDDLVCNSVQDLEPEVRTFNTAIIACNMCGQPQEALKVRAGAQAVKAAWRIRATAATRLCLADNATMYRGHYLTLLFLSFPHSHCIPCCKGVRGALCNIVVVGGG